MILALHGNLGSPADWENLDIPDLRAVDLWQYSHLTFAEFAEAISDTDDRPILAGYSLGGRLALHAMSAYPERWSGAVIVSAHPGLPRVEDRIARKISDGVWAERARNLDWLKFLEKWNAQPVFSDSVDLDSQIALEPKRETIADAFGNWSLGLQENLRPKLPHFEAPVLWITGERDAKFTAIADSMTYIFSDFRHESLPDCGHRVLQEQPSEVRDLIVEFVRTAKIAG